MTKESLDDMIGERCWHVSGGGVTVPSFKLVLGEKVRRPQPLKNRLQPKIFRENRGSVELLVWCSWRLQTSERALGTSDQGEIGISEVRKLVGAEVIDVECKPPAWDLRLAFSDGRILVVFCDHLQPEASFSQNWELWLPNLNLTAGSESNLLIEDAKDYDEVLPPPDS